MTFDEWFTVPVSKRPQGASFFKNLDVEDLTLRVMASDKDLRGKCASWLGRGSKR